MLPLALPFFLNIPTDIPQCLRSQLPEIPLSTGFTFVRKTKKDQTGWSLICCFWCPLWKYCEKDLCLLSAIIQDKDGPNETTVSAGFFLDRLRTLRSELNLPSRPSELGIRREDASILLKKTLMQTRRIKTNPRPIDDELLSFIEKGI